MLSLVTVAMVGSTAWSCEDEDQRVTKHLEDALSQLRAVAPPELSDLQRTRRARLIEDLARYVDLKQFPRTSGSAGPVFVDEDDHHCAMGALLAWNGGREIVHHVRSTRNLATVPTLADEPGLAEWLTENGMTVEEAALVQPTYYVCVPALDVCWGRGIPQEWYANGQYPPDGGDPVRMRVASADGQCAGPPTYYPHPDLPLGMLFSVRHRLASAGDDFVHSSWVQCRNPLRISRSALMQPTAEGCMREMIAADPRALLPSCGQSEQQVRRCADDGRYFAANLPDAGVEAAVRAYFSRYGDFDLDDAGISLAAAGAVQADAWAHSDEGGSVPSGDFAQLLSWSGTNPHTCVFLEDGRVENRADGGRIADADAGAPHDAGTQEEELAVDAGNVPGPRSHGCSTSAGCAVVLAVLLVRVRRRDRRPAC